MAFNRAPTQLFPGYSSNGVNISIPITEIVGLTSAKADTVSGDWREIVYGLCTTAFLHYISLSDEDKPQAFKASPPTRYIVGSGALSGAFRETFQFQFWNEYSYGDVVDEPA